MEGIGLDEDGLVVLGAMGGGSLCDTMSNGELDGVERDEGALGEGTLGDGALGGGSFGDGEGGVDGFGGGRESNKKAESWLASVPSMACRPQP